MALSHLSEHVGRVLGGRYRLLVPVGSGASAQVYLAEDVQLRRRVAVKVLHPALADDPVFERRFQAEAQAAAALNHPNIVAVYDWGSDELPFIVTEYLDGGSLRAVIGGGRALTLSQVLLVGLEAARGLNFAHNQGFVHRDVKPANLVFGADHRLRVADFGLARALAEAAWTEPEGVMLGTARYASPEQAGGELLDGRSDVYSLALVLVECGTGVVPHVSDTALGTLRGRVGRSIEPPEQLGPLVPILAAAGRADPAERLTAAELGRALMAAAQTLAAPKRLPLVPIELAPSVDDVTAAVAVGPVRSLTTRSAPPSSPPVAGTGADATMADLTTLGAEATRVVPEPGGPVAPPAASPLAAPPAAAPPPAAPTDGGGRRARRNQRRRGRSRVKRVARWAAVFLVLAALATVVALAYETSRPPARFPLLRVVGMSETAARTALEGAGHSWVVNVETTRAEGTDVGEVLDQAPIEGERLTAGSVVNLVVSAGEPLVRVPAGLENTPVAEVATALAAAHLVLAEPQVQQADENVVPGSVISVAGVGTEVERGTPVTVVVSTGPALRTIPATEKMTPEQATAALTALALTVTPAEEYSETVGLGLVVRTDPAAAAQVAKGSAVTVYVSLGRQPITVPYLLGVTPQEAFDQLESLGLQGTLDGQPNRTVVGTNPINGSTLHLGDTVQVISR